MKRKKPGMKEIIAKATPKLPRHEVKEIGDRVWLKLKGEMESRKDELALRSLYGDGWNHAPALEEGDFQILSAAKMLAGKGTIVDFLNTVEKFTAKTLLVQTRIEQLEERGLVTGTEAEAFKRRFQVTVLGERALGRARLEGKEFHARQAAPAEEKASELGGLAAAPGGNGPATE
jgi:hypothetical protein